jgi:hypothetical protein
MKLLEDFYDAREALEMALRIMSSEERTEREKLDAMLTAFAAERSIELLLLDQKDGVNFTELDPEFWQRRYNEVKAFRDAYMAAKRRANEASRRAFLASMKSSFDELPEGLKEVMDASFNPVYGWRFITEY